MNVAEMFPDLIEFLVWGEKNKQDTSEQIQK